MARLSHRFFVDDLMLFTETSLSQADVILDCLNRFCDVSGQTIRRVKSLVCFSHTVPLDVALSVTTMLEIPIT